MCSIGKFSTELNDEKRPRWHFPSDLSPETHCEWGLYRILQYTELHEILPPGKGRNRTKLKKDIEECHIAYNLDFDMEDLDTFISRRPDGLAFDYENQKYVILEYTRAMDEDWPNKKEMEKDDRYSTHLGFINNLNKKEERLESRSKQLYNRSTRLPRH